MNEDKHIKSFCSKIKHRLGASECLTFASRTESIFALFDIIQLRAHDCVFLPSIAPRDVVNAVMMCGAVPVFCDVTPDGLTLDPRSLESQVSRIMSEGLLYPRAVAAENFCGMPFAVSPINKLCDRMGLLLLEDCGSCFGGSSDVGECGAIGDYSLISLGSSTAFASGGRGALLIANGDNAAEEFIMDEQCGCGYSAVDGYYAAALDEAAEHIDEKIKCSSEFCQRLLPLANDCDCWLQRGSSRMKSSFGSVAVITQDKSQCDAMIAEFEKKDLGEYVKAMHSHTRNCFESNGKGLKDIINGSAISQKAFVLDVFLALNTNKTEDILKLFEEFAKDSPKQE